MPGKINIAGQRFGKLIAIKEVPKEQRKGGLVTWECKCDCGNTVLITTKQLRNGKAQSCGCLYHKDLVGKRYTRLLVISPTEIRKHGSVVWKCQCDCGNICYATTEGLRTGDNKSCGCLLKERQKNIANNMKIDLSGKRFGNLIVIEATEQRTKQQTRIWKCQCDCGNICYVTTNHLQTGNTKSCGCLQGRSYGELKIKEILLQNNIKFKSEYIFSELPNRRYDFAIFNQNETKLIQLIEFDGEQHYFETSYFKLSLEEQQLIDQEKTNFANEQKIKLIRIPYWKRDTLTLEDLEIDLNELSQ